MALFTCAGCEAKEREIERLHDLLKRTTELRFEAVSPGVVRRAAPRPEPTGPPPKPAPDPLPGYERTNGMHLVEFVEE